MCDNLNILNAIKLHKSDEGAIIQNTALSDQADKPHTNISLRIKQTGFSHFKCEKNGCKKRPMEI